MKNSIKQNRGFTLIEVMVSISIFSIVMLVATGSVFSIVEANKKTHSLKSVMTNLNFALESMARDMRVGLKYSCDGVGDCPSGGNMLIYKANRSVDGNGTYDIDDLNDRIEYSLVGERLMKRVYGAGASAYPLTAEEIHITSLKFYATGTQADDGAQPKIVMTVRGYAGVGETRSDFNIQTTVSQRSIDT